MLDASFDIEFLKESEKASVFSRVSVLSSLQRMGAVEIVSIVNEGCVGSVGQA